MRGLLLERIFCQNLIYCGKILLIVGIGMIHEGCKFLLMKFQRFEMFFNASREIRLRNRVHEDSLLFTDFHADSMRLL